MVVVSRQGRRGHERWGLVLQVVGGVLNGCLAWVVGPYKHGPVGFIYRFFYFCFSCSRENLARGLFWYLEGRR